MSAQRSTYSNIITRGKEQSTLFNLLPSLWMIRRNCGVIGRCQKERRSRSDFFFDSRIREDFVASLVLKMGGKRR